MLRWPTLLELMLTMHEVSQITHIYTRFWLYRDLLKLWVPL